MLDTKLIFYIVISGMKDYMFYLKILLKKNHKNNIIFITYIDLYGLQTLYMFKNHVTCNFWDYDINLYLFGIKRLSFQKFTQKFFFFIKPQNIRYMDKTTHI